MKWFKHDSDAHTDAKLKKLRHKYGITGYGLYWYCIELIAKGVDKNNITFELEEDAEIIALEWHLDQLKVEEMMRYMIDLGLFESSGPNITCMKLAKRLDDTNSKNPQIKQILANISRNNSESVGETPSNSVQNRLDQNRLDNKEKGKSCRFVPPTLEEISQRCIEMGYALDPERFYNHYESNGWKVGKNKMKSWTSALANWNKRERDEKSSNNGYQPGSQSIDIGLNDLNW